MDVKSEARLVEAAQGGHLDSFGALYERYYRAMVALAYSVLTDRNQAEDAAQESFAIACRALPTLRSSEKFAVWLGTICRNVARQMQRRESRFATKDIQRPLANEKSRDERCEVVRRAVWKLRAGDREVIVLRYYDNMAYNQIAAVLGISPQAVHGRLVRAKRKIAGQLKRDGLTGGNHEKR
jgi:RNA polymerase sigma-70 factor (ECF subfamily)